METSSLKFTPEEIAAKIVSEKIDSFYKEVKKKLGAPHRERATEEAIKIIKENKGKENFFMLIDYVDTHRPYNPRKFIGKFNDDSGFLKWMIARYDEAILYSDYQIKDDKARVSKLKQQAMRT